MNSHLRDAPYRLSVLKFGSSVLAREEDYVSVALEIYRHLREGEKVIAVVSALEGQTDALLDQAERVGGGAPDILVARLARVGELQSAALLALALSRTGLRACTLDPHEMGLMGTGDPLDSNLVDLDAAAIHARLGDHEVVVVPGFTADHPEHGVVTLGRGGTDLSAVFFAERLKAHRVRLIKDVDGVYDCDPAVNPAAQRYSQIDYCEAVEVSDGVIQPKAIRAAEAGDVPVEVAALGSAAATIVGRLPARKSRPPRPRQIRVALLGCGTVGGGVLHYVQSRSDLFALNPVLVRNPDRHRGDAIFTTDAGKALQGDPDLVVELLGGADYPADLMHSALRRGAEVVTANKAAVAEHFDSLHASAEAGGARLRYSGAVGGVAPVLETLERLHGQVVFVEGVMSGTCNYLLSRLGEGISLEAAVIEAQQLGFAEADASADVDSHDAAAKLSILARKAFGVPVPPKHIARQSLASLSPADAQAALANGQILKQVGRCKRLADGRIEAEVAVVALDRQHPLAGARNEANRFLVGDSSGAVHRVFGKGAGRWPTAAAVFADMMDAQRALLQRCEQADSAPVRLSA